MAQKERKNIDFKWAHRGPLNSAALYGRAGLLAKSVRAGARAASSVGALLMMVMVLLGAGCASAPAVAAPEGVEQMAPAELLYSAALSTYETREIPVAVASARFLIITSEFQPVDADLRKRMVTQVVRAAPGAMGLTVTTQWETRVEKDADLVWQTVDTPILRERGNAEELLILRDIEQRFNAWKGSSSAH